jgi:hypothetical protein
MTTPGFVVPEAKSAWFGLIPAFALHTFLIYILALHISPILVGRWFAWVLPAIQFHATTASRDWYLQDLELVTIIPALAAGYINVVRFIPTIVGGHIKDARHELVATWVWIVPALVLLYRIAQYNPPSSVLIGSSMSAFRYFFDIEREMPRLTNVLVGDPVRVWAQMSVTAPFYAGVAYSLGALSSKHQIFQRIFAFGKEDTILSQDHDVRDTTPVPPSSSPD